LAIECDGDEFHGPDRWQHDLSRQRVLERAGWVFWRCFASTWVLRKDEVMEELVQFLYRMEIEPLGAIETAARMVEKRVIKTESKTLDGQDEQSPDASVSGASDGAHKLSHGGLDIQKSTVGSPHADQAVNMILTNTDGNGAELRSSESHKHQSLQSGDRVT
jgi:hypothetical protein